MVRVRIAVASRAAVPNANRLSRNFPLEASLITLTLLLGAFHAWLGRAAMDPDGMSYLDVGQSFFRHDWANAVNGWWSPLYPWTVGLVLGFAKPSPEWEFPLTQVIDFGIFALALLAFRFTFGDSGKFNYAWKFPRRPPITPYVSLRTISPYPAAVPVLRRRISSPPSSCGKWAYTRAIRWL